MNEKQENIDKSGANDAESASKVQTPRTINSLADYTIRCGLERCRICVGIGEGTWAITGDYFEHVYGKRRAK